MSIKGDFSVKKILLNSDTGYFLQKCPLDFKKTERWRILKAYTLLKSELWLFKRYFLFLLF